MRLEKQAEKEVNKMEQENIHDGLENSEIRTYLSKTLHTTMHNGAFGGSEEYIKEQIEKLQKQLEQVKIRMAIEQLIKQNGWKWWDISDEISYDPKTYFDFVGTPEEFKTFMKVHCNKKIILKHHKNGDVDYEIKEE
jgi:ribosomal protein S20